MLASLLKQNVWEEALEWGLPVGPVSPEEGSVWTARRSERWPWLVMLPTQRETSDLPASGSVWSQWASKRGTRSSQQSGTFWGKAEENWRANYTVKGDGKWQAHYKSPETTALLSTEHVAGMSGANICRVLTVCQVLCVGELVNLITAWRGCSIMFSMPLQVCESCNLARFS